MTNPSPRLHYHYSGTHSPGTERAGSHIVSDRGAGLPHVGPEPPGRVDPTEMAARLRIISGLIVHRTRDSTAVAELSPTQVSILGRLGRNGALSSADLAKSERLKPQTIRNLVDGLRTRGLVVGVRDSVDARRNMFALTTEGRGWVRGRRATAADRVLTRVLTEQLSETELATVTEALSLLERLAFAPPDPPSTHRDTLTG